MTYKPTQYDYTYDSGGNVIACTITQYGGVGTNIVDNTQVDVAFPDPVVIDMAINESDPGGNPNNTQSVNIGCGWGSSAHEHCYIGLTPASADMWFTYHYRINLGPPYGWVTLVYDTGHFHCQTWVFPAGFGADFHSNPNQAPVVARISGSYTEFDAHCG